MSTDPDVGRPCGDDETVRATFDGLPVIACALAGPQLRLVACNAAHRAFYPNALLGVAADDFGPELREQGILDMYDRVYQTGEPLHVAEVRVQVDLDGSGVRERFVNITAVAQRDSRGEITGVVIVGADTTESVQARLAAEERAREMAGRYQSARAAAGVMQRVLLSPSVPVLPGAEIAAAYLVATQDTAAGGDWFDALTDPGGRLLLVVGDVVGHGVQAAAVMAQLRTAVRMQFHSGAGILDSLAAVDRFVAEIPGAKSATLCVGRLDTATGEFEYCTAGHPPPLVIPARGKAQYLQSTGSGPLGGGRGFGTRKATLAVGDLVMLYSDGIIERPGRDLAASAAEVAEVTARVASGKPFPLDPAETPVDRLCSHAVELLVRTTGYSDDITLLAAQRRTPPPALHIESRADETAERTVRASLRQWLAGMGADAGNTQSLVHAVSELVANVAEHAYDSASPGDFSIDAELDFGGRVRVVVADSGTWKDAESGAHRGRGLAIARAAVPDTIVTHSGDGTTATATHILTRQSVYTELAVPAPRVSAPTTFDVGTSEDGYIVVVGDVDTLAAPELREVLSVRSRAGTRSIQVDLSAVTHLGSAAVSVLADACDLADRQRTTCTLVAVPGGVAHDILAMVGLPATHEPADSQLL
ncbi:SpoIIE family protein phosphatase [Mycobacterium sp. TY814]|uniref:SpoIIE family protein phosphatase n=1 Tax=unclassified Mycobacterium TaxID=2642494 RepID=UPI000FAB3E8C|nr:SpoIIE family protein phosphatase [Mycobacterium sp. TY814]MDP7725291.1 SpoIIE family protein phosphatase [Mycobacterium sp. TY814]RUP07351.1 MAG: STAS domain-containing protein [Mycobacterium sp.]